MTRIDFTPMFRSTVGFDRMMNVMDAMLKPDSAVLDYPPYNIEKTGEQDYRIALAVAGFTLDDLQVETRDDTLYVRGTASQDGDERHFLHRGISGRDFERRFALADHVRVTGAHLDNGLLIIDLVHEMPEAKRPRKIEIVGPAATGSIEHKTEVNDVKNAA